MILQVIIFEKWLPVLLYWAASGNGSVVMILVLSVCDRIIRLGDADTDWKHENIPFQASNDTEFQ